MTDIELVAVTKTHAAEIVREAIDAGQTLFGDNKVQEARAKIPLLPSNLRWHFIGHLQKNKIRHALPLFEMIHSVDSLDLAQAIDRIAHEDGLHPRILLEVNVAGEGSKFGFQPDKLREKMELLMALPRVAIEGLMCIPPLAEEAEVSRKHFVELRELRDALGKEFQVKLPQLSMGMTNDYSVAVEEGRDACPGRHQPFSVNASVGTRTCSLWALRTFCPLRFGPAGYKPAGRTG